MASDVCNPVKYNYSNSARVKESERLCLIKRDDVLSIENVNEFHSNWPGKTASPHGGDMIEIDSIDSLQCPREG